MKNPTLKEKVQVYEALLHKIQLHAQVAMNRAALGQIIQNICDWSYAHRCGNGEYSVKKQRRIINAAFKRLK